MLETLYLKWFFIKKFEIFEKNDFFRKKMSKSCFRSILTSNLERTKNIQKIKIFNFFRKKVITQKKEFCSYSEPLFILAHPTSEKNLAKIIWVKTRFNIKSAKINFLKKLIFCHLSCLVHKNLLYYA
jgi:hypothetical protein